MTDNPTYDVAIIGGGLAGLCLSIQAANAGYKVVLLEKEEYPFHRVCGEYISNESRPFLEQLGVPLQQWDLPTITTLHVSDVRGRLSRFSLPLGGFGVSRYKLDDCLYQLALQKGVEVRTNWKVLDCITSATTNEVVGQQGSIYATVLAGCFGKRSNIDVKWDRPFVRKRGNGLNNYVGIKYHVKYEHEADVIALHNFYNGYCGMSKIEEGLSCLCYLTTAANLQANGNSIPQMERNVLFKNPLLRTIFSKAEFVFAKPVAISQVSFSKKAQVEDHMLMVGDSAGMITPLCGNGMSMAMHASKLAFQSMDAYLSGDCSKEEMENCYTTNWKKHFALRLTMGRMVQQIFGGNLTTSLFFSAMAAVPPLARQIIKTTHGQPF